MTRDIKRGIAPGTKKNVHCMENSQEARAKQKETELKAVFPELRADKDTTIIETQETKPIPLGNHLQNHPKEPNLSGLDSWLVFSV